MFDFFVIPGHDRRLIPEGRLSGPTPWIIAIMIFLTALAAAAGLAFAESANNVSDQLSRRATIQIIEANPDARARQTRDAAARLRGLDIINEVRVLPPAEIEKLIQPWLGEQGISEDIPLPALIDVTLHQSAGTEQIKTIQAAIQPLVDNVRVEPSSSYIEPVIQLVRSLQWLALAVIGLLALATMAAVIIAAKATLNSHRATISVIHLLGGTDRQISRLFQRRIALDALLGGIVGLIGALAVIWLLGTQLAGLESGLVRSFRLSWYSWVIIAAIPLFGMFLAMLTARSTVMSALKKIL